MKPNQRIMVHFESEGRSRKWAGWLAVYRLLPRGRRPRPEEFDRSWREFVEVKRMDFRRKP